MSIGETITESFNSVKEFFSGQTVSGGQIQDYARTTAFGNIEYLKGIYNKAFRTPHNEFRECEKIYRWHPSIVAGVELFTDSILGDELSVETDDPEGKHFFENHVIPKLKPALRQAIETMLYGGNGYIEIARSPRGEPLKFNAIARHERVYIDYDGRYNPTKYVLQIPHANKENFPSHHVNYLAGRREIHGVDFEPNNIIHLKSGVSSIPIYGRSGLASAIDTGKILRELERDMAVIARYKSVGKKIITMKNPDGTTISDQEKKKAQEAIKNAQDFENITINKDAEIKDLEYGGEFHDMQPALDYLGRKLTRVLVPGFYMHGDVTRYAIAKEQKASFDMRVGAKRDIIRSDVDSIFKEIAEFRGYDTDVTVSFGEYSVPTRDDLRDDWKAGYMTLNEIREAIGLEPDEELGDLYSMEFKDLLTPEQQMQDGLEALRKEVGEDVED